LFHSSVLGARPKLRPASALAACWWPDALDVEEQQSPLGLRREPTPIRSPAGLSIENLHTILSTLVIDPGEATRIVNLHIRKALFVPQLMSLVGPLCKLQSVVQAACGWSDSCANRLADISRPPLIKIWTEIGLDAGSQFPGSMPISRFSPISRRCPALSTSACPAQPTRPHRPGLAP
jgi:hypothetical protein